MAKNKKQQNNQSTRQRLDIEGITEHSLKTASNEAIFFSIKPSNISVMSEASLSVKIYPLMGVLKGLTEIEILCVSSRESFESQLDQKVLSAIPGVEIRNGDIYGVITVKSYSELNKVEMMDLIDDLTGQLADGFGESFEQREIKLGEDTVYISFWDCDDDYFLKSENEAFSKQEINQGMECIY